MGIDHDPHYLRQAQWAARQFGLQAKVEFKLLQVYDLAAMVQTYDLVVFMGVLYHLRYPMLGLDIISQKVRRLLLVQTLMMPGEDVYQYTEDGYINERDVMLEPGWPKLAFIENRFAGDPTNWWVPNHSCVEAMLRSSGMKILQRPAHEVYVCEPDSANLSCVASWNRGEYLSATGQAGNVLPGPGRST
jgi:tRNA (mo5U34)-methyltransferase